MCLFLSLFLFSILIYIISDISAFTIFIIKFTVSNTDFMFLLSFDVKHLALVIVLL